MHGFHNILLLSLPLVDKRTHNESIRAGGPGVLSVVHIFKSLRTSPPSKFHCRFPLSSSVRTGRPGYKYVIVYNFSQNSVMAPQFLQAPLLAPLGLPIHLCCCIFNEHWLLCERTSCSYHLPSAKGPQTSVSPRYFFLSDQLLKA